ncbi:MAG TPA: AAA family ATPase, partial [Dermatophilaceae bacterium]
MTSQPSPVRPGRLILVTGTQAAGKSTVGAALAGRFGRGMFVDGDEIAAMVVSGRVGYEPDAAPAATEQLLLRYRGSIAVARTYQGAGFDAVIADNVFGELLDDFIAMVQPAPLHVVVLHPSIETITGREIRRSKRGYGDGTWQVENLYDVVEQHTKRVGLWLDTTEQTVDQTVDTILSRLDEARLDACMAMRHGQATWSGGELVVVDRVGGVLAAVGVGPGAVAVPGHGQGPAGFVFDPVVVFAEADQVPDRGGSAAGVGGDVVGFAPVGASGAAGEAAVAVALSDESAHRPVGQVGVDAGLDHHAGAFLEQDPGDAGVEPVQDPGDDVAA